MVKVEHQSKESFSSLLEYIIEDIGVRKVYFSQKTPILKGRVSFMDIDSLDIPLSGTKHMNFANGGETLDVHLTPGDIHCAPAMHWKRPLWDSPHEMSSIVYYNDHIRLTYINNVIPTSRLNEHPPATIFYHTSIPLEITGTSIWQTLGLMADSGNEVGAVESLNALLRITLDTLKSDTSTNTGKARNTWLMITQYMRDHFDSPINRAHVAHVFKLNPSYVSRLFKSFGNENFNAMLRRIRFEHAAILLTRTNLTIDEITDACGYLSSTYFISAFHKQYGMPPGKYRIGK